MPLQFRRQHIKMITPHVWLKRKHYNDVIMSAMASITIVYSMFYSSPNQRKHQNSASLAVVRGIHRWPVIPPHTGPVTRKMFSFDDVIMTCRHFETPCRSLWRHYNELCLKQRSSICCTITQSIKSLNRKYLLQPRTWLPLPQSLNKLLNRH